MRTHTTLLALNRVGVLLVACLFWPAGQLAAAATATRPASSPASAPAAADAEGGSAALAERFAQLARDPRLGWQGSAVLLEAACRLRPNELRFARLLAEAELQAGNRQEAVAALNACRRLDDDDRRAQVQLIDLHISGMETASARYNYLSRLANERTLADEVRGHAALRAAELLLEQSRREQAAAMLDLALRLDPLSMAALRLRYEQLAFGSTPRDRVAILLAMVRADPAEASAASELGRELAAAGLVQQSLNWYALAVNLSQRSGQFLGPDAMRGYATELFLAGQDAPAGTLAEQLLSADPLDVDAWLLRLVTARKQLDQGAYAKLRRQAQVALSNRLALARQAAGGPPATTRPLTGGDGADVDVPDLSADVKRLSDPQQAEQRPALMAAVADWAWFELYFSQRPAAAATLIQALTALMPEGDPLVARLEGWRFLLDGKAAEAKVKLSAVADRDPLAALGLYKLQQSAVSARQTPAATQEAQRLLSLYPSGLVAAILRDSLQDSGAQVAPGSAAASLEEELKRFPSPWLAILDRPQDFYIVRLEPLKVTHSFGEPVLARVTVQNISDYDLTVGRDGILHPDLWFDAQLRGTVQRAVPATAYDQLAEPLVLRARQGTSQVVRLDQGALATLLQANPAISLQITATVLTNPAQAGPTSGPGPGPAGYRVQMHGIVERQGLAMNSDEAKSRVYGSLSTGSAQEKIQSLDLLGVYIGIFRSQRTAEPQAAETLRPLLAEFVQTIGKACQDPSPAAAAWASYLSAVLAEDDPGQQAMTKAMLSGGNWEQRLLGALAGQARPVPQQQELAARLATDPDPLVRRFAGVWMQVLAQSAPPATGATTAPAAAMTQPAPAATPGHEPR